MHNRVRTLLINGIDCKMFIYLVQGRMTKATKEQTESLTPNSTIVGDKYHNHFITSWRLSSTLILSWNFGELIFLQIFDSRDSTALRSYAINRDRGCVELGFLHFCSHCQPRIFLPTGFAPNQSHHVIPPTDCVTLAVTVYSTTTVVRVSGRRKPLFKFANYLMIGQTRTRPLQFPIRSVGRFPICTPFRTGRERSVTLAMSSHFNYTRQQYFFAAATRTSVEKKKQQPRVRSASSPFLERRVISQSNNVVPIVFIWTFHSIRDLILWKWIINYS